MIKAAVRLNWELFGQVERIPGPRRLVGGSIISHLANMGSWDKD